MNFYIKNNPIDRKGNISFILYHHQSMSEDELLVTIDSYEKQKFLPEGTIVQIIVMLDGVKLSDFPIIEHSILRNNQNLIFVETDEVFLGPGAMWNKGLEVSNGERVIFTWTGAYWYPDSLFHLNRVIIRQGVDAAYGLARYAAENFKSSHVMLNVGIKNLAVDCISFINSIPLCYTVVTREAAQKLEGFCNDIELSQIADWEFLIRLVTQFKIDALVGKPINIKIPLANIDYQYNFKHTLDENIRCFVTRTYNYFSTLFEGNQKNSLRCMKRDEYFYRDTVYKIAILSGLNENAQIQLCILNYLEFFEGQPIFTWRRFVENEIRPEELDGYDLVFFVRCRTLTALSAAKYCYEKKIKTIYLLDDNWFCATETYPQLESQIGKNSPYYNFFIMLISTVDYLLVYNEILLEDIKKYNSAIFRLSPNVNSDHFLKSNNAQTKNILNIGFAGSASKLQHFSAAFNALVKIMNEFENVNLYFKGIELPEVFHIFKERIVQSAYVYDYKAYAKEVSKWQYDIMISPLDNTRYINSKCPNKYLEITALGAAGIYSNTALYKSLIKDQYNGLIINNNEEEWYNALKLLILNESLRKSIIKNAIQEINRKYDTKVILPQFILMLKTVLEKKIDMDMSIK